jgi:glycosyltransferase involved in cell wall biosynthesis
MRLLCVVNGGAEHPSSRFRVLQHLDLLRGNGFDTDVLVAKRRDGYDLPGLRRRAVAADVVLVQKKLFAAWKLLILPRRVPLVFDFDDAVWSTRPEEEERFGPARAARRAASRGRRLTAILRGARRVIAGNRYLADHAAPIARAVVVLPTGVDLTPFPEGRVRRAAESRREHRDGRRIGWIGSRSSLRYLKALADPLRIVCARTPGARLVQVCDDFIDLPGVPTETRRWSAESEAEDLFGFDVGLMPIDDQPFARGKCGLKILQYHAAGVPVVASPVGANRDIVRDGETGLLADSGDAWVAAITRLLADPNLGARLALAGRARLAASYSAQVVGSRLAGILREVAGERGVRAGSAAGALPGEEG